MIMIITMKNRIALSIPISGSIEKMDNTPIEFFDVMRVTDATEAYDTQFASDDDFETYLNDMKNQSSYTIPDAWPSKTDHIVSLSTCVAAHGSTRMIIQGKLVNITDYSGDDIPLTSLTTQNQNSNDTPDSSEQQ